MRWGRICEKQTSGEEGQELCFGHDVYEIPFLTVASEMIRYGHNSSLNKMEFYCSLSQRSGGRQSKAGKEAQLHESP